MQPAARICRQRKWAARRTDWRAIGSPQPPRRSEVLETQQVLRCFQLSRNANDHGSVSPQPLVNPRRITGIVVASIQGHLHLRISPEGVAEVRIQVALVSCHQNDPLVIAPRGVGPGRAFFLHTTRAEQAQGHLRDTCNISHLGPTRLSRFRRDLSPCDENCYGRSLLETGRDTDWDRRERSAATLRLPRPI